MSILIDDGCIFSFLEKRFFVSLACYDNVSFIGLIIVCLVGLYVWKLNTQPNATYVKDVDWKRAFHSIFNLRKRQINCCFSCRLLKNQKELCTSQIQWNRIYQWLLLSNIVTVCLHDHFHSFRKPAVTIREEKPWSCCLGKMLGINVVWPRDERIRCRKFTNSSISLIFETLRKTSVRPIPSVYQMSTIMLVQTF